MVDIREWIPHHRALDGELVGWIRPSGADFVPVSLFGVDLAEASDWLVAEARMDEEGLAWIADPWMLERDGETAQVRIIEVSPDRIAGGALVAGHVTVKHDDFGAVDALTTRFRLPWPPPPQLRPLRPGEGQSPWG